MPAITSSADSKSRQSSGGRSFFGRKQKEKSQQDPYAQGEGGEVLQVPSGGSNSANGSQSSRHSSHKAPLSPMEFGREAQEDLGLSMTAGVITSIPYDSVPAGVKGPIPVDFLPKNDPQSPKRREPLPHHLNKGGGDFHQYPAWDPQTAPMSNGSTSHLSGPRPPPHTSSSSTTSSLKPVTAALPTRDSSRKPISSYTVDLQNGPIDSHGTVNSISTGDSASNHRKSFDQMSVMSSVSSATRGSSIFSSDNASRTAVQERPSTSGRGSHFANSFALSQPAGFGSTHSSQPDGFHFPRPNDDRIIEQQFVDMMNKRNFQAMPEQAKRQMLAYPASKKWQMVHQDKMMEWQGEQKRRQAARNTILSIDGSLGTISKVDEEGSPEWYVRKVINDTITPKQLGSLSVSLRTQPISWVKAFVEAQGQVALTNVLAKINRRQGQGPAPASGTTSDRDLDREYDIIKCLKALMNNKYGADDALTHQQVVVSLATSLISPRLNTRKLVSEVLTFLCHWAEGEGHLKVLQAMDQVKNHQGENGRFDAWMRIVEVTIDGRGKMGSRVGASDELRSGGINMENLLMEYAVATLFLLNMMIDAPEHDLQLRCHIRAQFTSCGIKRILHKMEDFQYEVIDKQIERYRENEAIDYEDLLQRENSSIKDSIEGEAKDLQDPAQVVEAIMSKVSGTRAQDYFMSAMQHMLLIRDTDGEDRLRMFQLVDAMLSYVAMDRRLPDMDLKQSLNFSVQSLLDRLHTDSEARQALDETTEARQIADSAIAERDEMKARIDMGADGLVAKLQKQLDEQAQIIELQKRQNDAQKAELADLQRIRAQELQRNELETRELYLMLRDAQDFAASVAKKGVPDALASTDPQKMQGILDRETLMARLETQLERAKTQCKLEGKVWQQAGPSDRLRELREQMDDEEEGGQRESFADRVTREFSAGPLGMTSRSKLLKGPRRAAAEALAQESGSDDGSYKIEGDGDDAVLYEKPRLVEMKRPQMSARQATGLLGEIAAKVRRYDASEDEEGDGITTGPSHPSLESESPRTPVDEAAPKAMEKSKEMPPPPLPASVSGKMPGFDAGPPPPGAPPLPGLPKGGYLPQSQYSQTPVLNLPTIRPKKKLKALHWDKVDAPQVTVWATHTPTHQAKEEKYQELSRKGVLDEVEKLFMAKEIKKIGGTSGKKSDKKQIISSDLRQKFLISLAKFSALDSDEVIRMIIHCDREILDNNVVMDFLQKDDLCTVPENTAKLMAPYSRDWTGPDALKTPREQDPSELTREDQIYLATAFELSHYWKSRMRALLLTRTFENEYDEISKHLKDIVTVSESLRDSVALMNILGLILDIGNYMNDSNKQATGFKLSSLGRLAMVKDEKNETTFADLVERIVRNQYPEWEGFIDDIAGVVTAQKLNVEQLRVDAKKYIDNIRNVQRSLDSGNLSDPKKFHPQDRVSQVVQRSMKDARRKAEQMQLYLDEMNRTYDDIMTFYGEDKTDDNSRREFFSKLANFVLEWKRSKEKNMAMEETRRRNEASMARKRANVKGINPAAANCGGGTSDGPLSPSSTGAMDTLLEKLRAAAPQARDQRDRRRRARLKDRHQVRIASGQSIPDLGDLTKRNGEEGEGGDEVHLSPGNASNGDAGPEKMDPISESEDVAERAASMLQGLRDNSNNDTNESGRPISGDGSGSLGVRRRRESADEERRNRRRRRARESSSTAPDDEARPPTSGKDEEMMAGEGNNIIVEELEEEKVPTTVVSPPSPEGGATRPIILSDD
ncbi:MAG: hypothetical protein Q9163_000664 [Psora crenata]